ncbi:MAG: DUF4012 domain-containing protein [bacterium]|nr:DUF4012 domain-containing protein [bacterium]
MSKKIFLDIKPPSAYLEDERQKKLPQEYASFKRRMRRVQRWKNIKITTLVSLAIVFTLSGLSFAQVLHFKNSAEARLVDIKQNFQDFGKHLSEFQLVDAEQSLIEARTKIRSLERSSYVAQFWGLAVPKLKNIGTTFDELNNLTTSLANIIDDVGYLKDQTFHLLINNGGSQIIGKLKEVASELAHITKIGDNLAIAATSFGQIDSQPLQITDDLNTAQSFLTSLVDWLSQDQPQNLVLLFQNPSEIRPAGGFIGSYAEVQLDRASLVQLKVVDIYDPDGQLPVKIVPPKPLQSITNTWGARDANWFFDFPASASKVLQMLETSKIYQERDIKFAGAIALNVNIIESILEIVGPIELAEYDLVIDEHNFLAEVQREVEAGDDKKAGEPKRILKVLTPIFFQKMGELDDGQKQELMTILKDHLTAKDIIIYLKDPALESHFRTLGLAGEVFQPNPEFSGDYLAVVNANIAGGKSDAFIKQSIKLSSRIDNDGNANNELTISRRHQGENQKEWWYKATNKTYTQILVPPTAKLASAEGGKLRTTSNYSKRDYETDPDVKNIEATASLIKSEAIEELMQFGKKTFATWLEVPAGEEKKLVINYKVAGALEVNDGVKYAFVFDKQSGVESNLEIVIEAPLGYKWLESKSAFFTYKNSELPTRVMISLTLTR